MSLTELTNQEGFWTDLNNAKIVNKKLSDNSYKLDKIDYFKNKLDDIKDSLEFLSEIDDEEVLNSTDVKVKTLESEFSEFEKFIYYFRPYDSNNAILEFHPGAGGTEAHDWANMLLRMYLRYAEDKGYKVKIIDLLEGEEAGISSCTILVTGKNAYGNLRSEHGVHRLVRISPFDASGSRHTSFASVNVMPEFNDDIQININPADLKIDTYHSSGAGGQNVNKTESAVRITHLPTGIVVSCQVERDQLANKETCMDMLKSKLFQLEERKRQEKLDSISGVKKDISFSSQIRSYVFCPYTLVKDHRDDYSEVNVQAVMDGKIQSFIDHYLRYDFLTSRGEENEK